MLSPVVLIDDLMASQPLSLVPVLIKIHRGFEGQNAPLSPADDLIFESSLEVPQWHSPAKVHIHLSRVNA